MTSERSEGNLSTRRVLAAGTVAGLAGMAASARAASYGNPDEPPQGAVNVTRPADLTIPGPHSDAISTQFPSSLKPPATDVGSLPQFWASFNDAQRRIQNGGWARQVTQETFPISTTISGVDMRLGAGAIRELHWHQAAEWAYVTYGSCRVTILDSKGRASVADVKAGDLWYFPAGYPHSLQGLGPDGAQFLLCFDDGNQSEYDTLLVNEWFAHMPPDVLALNFGVPADAFKTIPLVDTYIFPSDLPQPLATDLKQVENPLGPPPNPSVLTLASGPATKQTKGGKVQIADSTNFHASTTVAAALVTVHPGGMREMHWHPNADEWQYWIKGKGRMTVFNTGPKAQTADFNPGDIGVVKKSLGHYIQNTGDTDLVFMEIFKDSRYQEVSLAQWLAGTPPDLLRSHLNMDPKLLEKFRTPRVVVPG